MVKDFVIGERVCLSALFLRSIGGLHPMAEDVGTVFAVVGDRLSWQLVLVCWHQAKVIIGINAVNLVRECDKTREAWAVEHKNLAPAVQIGKFRRPCKYVCNNS